MAAPSVAQSNTMAVLAEYRAPAPPGNAVRLGIQAYETGSSIMARKQQLRLMEQQQNLQQMEFIAKLPLLQAQTRLEQANAAAAIDNAVEQKTLEARAAAESVAAQKEFFDASHFNVANQDNYVGAAPPVREDGTVAPEDLAAQENQSKIDAQETLKARLSMLRDMSVKYAYMKRLKAGGYGAFYDTINQTLIQTNDALHGDLKLEELLAAQQMRTDGQIQARTVGANATMYSADARAGASMYGTDVRAANRLDVVQAQGANQLAVTDRKGEIQANREGDILDSLRKRQITALQDAQDAESHKDPALAESFRKHAKDLENDIYKRTNFAGGTPNDAPITKDTPVPRRPAPASASNSTPVGISLSLPGYAPVGEGTAPVAAPTEPATPTQAATVPETAHAAPVKLGKWDQRNALKPGTKYIGPDGILYIKK